MQSASNKRETKELSKKQSEPTQASQPSRASGAQPGQGRARPGAEFMLGQAELPPARPGSTTSHSDVVRAFVLLKAPFKAILAPFSSFRRHFQARQEPRQSCARGTLSSG